MMPHSPSLRVAFLRPEGPRSTIERQRLMDFGMEQQRIDETGGIHLAEWQSPQPGLQATVVLGQDLAAEDLACAYFSGTDRVALAAGLAPVLAYVPIELMHLAARTSPVTEERLAALTALGQFYLAEEDASYWDTDIEETLAIAKTDPNADIRQHALFSMVKGAPAEALADIAEILSESLDAVVCERLEALRRVAEKRAVEVTTSKPLRVGTLGLDEGRLALPTYVVDVIDKVISRFSDVACLVGRRSVEIDGEIATEVVEMKARELDASMLYLADNASTVGCAYFSGSDRVAMATGSAHVLHYFPIHLAKNVACFGEDATLRVMGLRALAWSASHQMLPGSAIDAEIRRIISAMLADSDPIVREAAASAAVLLREELAK